MHGGSSNEDEPMADMNMIPLIDIALTLLIIMMVTTAFIRKPGVALNLPKSAVHDAAREQPKDVIVEVAADGTYHVDGNILTPEALLNHMQSIPNKDTTHVLIKGDEKVPYANIMEVLDIVKQSGLTQVTLPTEPKRSQAAQLPSGAPNDVTGSTPATSPVQNR